MSNRRGFTVDGLSDALEAYINEIERFNPAYGLVKVADRAELVTKHILDSLAPLPLLKEIIQKYGITSACDVGSGAGLPGIPLALALPGIEWTLIERMGRRAGFLRNTQALLAGSFGVKNIAVEQVVMEKAKDGRFGLVVFRAFTTLNAAVLKGLLHLLKAGGIVAAYKGRRSVVDAEMEALKAETAARRAGFPDFEWKAVQYKVPGLDEERHLVLIRG
jgi:16S rRNA (guanine527-N7)-methyltransferase